MREAEITSAIPIIAEFFESEATPLRQLRVADRRWELDGNSCPIASGRHLHSISAADKLRHRLKLFGEHIHWIDAQRLLEYRRVDVSKVSRDSKGHLLTAPGFVVSSLVQRPVCDPQFPGLVGRWWHCWS